MKKAKKLVSVALSLCLATMMVPATAFAEAADAAGSADVPENLRLSDMRFADGPEFTWANAYPIEGGFDPAKSDVNLVINEADSQFAMHASLGTGVTGEITAEYTDVDGVAQSVVIDPEADENNAAYLRKVFKKADYNPVDMIVKVGGEKAYTVHIKRRATVPNVKVEGASGLGYFYFQKNKYEYNLETTSDSFTITPDFTNNTDGYNQENMLITGTGTVTPTWDENGKADVAITIADKDGKAVASTYTFHVQHYDTAKAQAVVAQIDAIGTVDLTKETQITDARAAYEALPAKLQPEVTNIRTLEAAELALSSLKNPEGSLEEVVIAGGWSKSDASYMTPAFSPSVRDYEVHQYNSVKELFVTAKDAYKDTPITVTYKNADTGETVTSNIKSGKDLYLSFFSPSGYTSNSLMLNVGGDKYRFTVYKTPSVDSLSLKVGSKTTELFNEDSGLGSKTGQSFSVAAKPGDALSASFTTWNTFTNMTASVTEPEWKDHAAQVTVNVSYDDYPDTKPYQAFVSLFETPSKIEILKAPDKTEYRLGESLDATGMEVRATYANGDTVMVNNDDLTLQAAGLNKMRVSYHGASAEQDIAIALSFSGSGTEEDPYVISTTDQIDDFAFAVNAGEGFEGKYFALGANVTLPTNWKPAGCMIDESLKSIKAGKNINPFSGTFDGKGYTVTVPAGQKPLFGYVKGATIKNLNIYGSKIDGYGLVNNMEGVGLSGNAVTIDNVTILSGSKILKSGFLGGECKESPYSGVSASYESTITNCTIEEGVMIGAFSQICIGSFAGRFQGTIENCVSYATVRGTSFVGGIIGSRDNAMGNVTVKNCAFHGAVQIVNSASAVNAGGIVGGTYYDNDMMSAPNGIRANIIGNYCDGTINGKNNVGGILGGDDMIAQAWNSYELKDNVFEGNITRGNAESTGAIIGFYRSLNKFDNISNNTYLPGCSSAVDNIKAIGHVDYVDTNNAAIVAQFPEGENSVTIDGTLYFNTEKNTKGCPSVQWCSWQRAYNRTDDPLGADAGNLFGFVAPAFEVSTAVAADGSGVVPAAVKAGDTVTVNVSVAANYGAAALSGTLDFDPAVFELVSVTKGAGLSEGASFLPAEGAAEALFSFYGNEVDATAQGGIVVATVTLKALKAADAATIGVKDATAAVAGDSLDYAATVGGIAAIDVLADATLGDANGNGRVNIVDAQVVYDMATGAYGEGYAALTLPTGWTHATLLWVANVNGDDAIDAVDAFAIQRFVHYGAWA